MTQSKTLEERIDALREEFQDRRPDVVMVLDELVDMVIKLNDLFEDKYSRYAQTAVYIKLKEKENK